MNGSVVLHPSDANQIVRLVDAMADRPAIITVEDHWPDGGLGDAVLAALAQAEERPPAIKLGFPDIPGSGEPTELLRAAGIDADAIAPRVEAKLSFSIAFASTPDGCGHVSRGCHQSASSRSPRSRTTSAAS